MIGRGGKMVGHCDSQPYSQVTTARGLREKIEAVLRTEPAFQLQYVSVGAADSMKPLADSTAVEPAPSHERGLCVSLAGVLGGVRLIDNMLYGSYR